MSEQNKNHNDFFSLYLKYAGVGEVSPILHRWGAIMAASVLLSRRCHFKFGNTRIFPNLYVIFMGESASKKSTAINLVRKLVSKTGYEHFAPSETSKGKFAMHLAGISDVKGNSKERQDLEEALAAMQAEKDGKKKSERISESFICAGELANFLGFSNFDFASFLGDMWDVDEKHMVSYKTAGEFEIVNPLINLLGGNTFEGMMKTLPPEMMGQGFLSRCIFVYAPAAKKKIAFPSGSALQDDKLLLDYLAFFANFSGEINLSPEAKIVLTDIYESWPGMMDHRFKAYAGRRFTQLIKLCCIEAVAARRNVISVQDALRANTWLSLTEALMPRALGEYGAGRNSMGSNAIMNVFYAKPDVHWKLDQLWEQTSSAFDTLLGFNTAVTGLLSAKKLALDNGHLTLTRALIPHGKYIKPDLFSEYLN